jgi:hypothetical protein
MLDALREKFVSVCWGQLVLPFFSLLTLNFVYCSRNVISYHILRNNSYIVKTGIDT